MLKKYIDVSFLFFIVFGVITLIIDFETNKTGSLFYLFISFINVLVMGILTFYIYKVNKQVADISRSSLQLTHFHMGKIKLNETNNLLGIIDEYIENTKLVRLCVLPYLTYNKKKEIIYFNFKDLKEDIDPFNFKDKIDLKRGLGIDLSIEETEKFKFVEAFFYNKHIPNSVKARYRLGDVILNLENLKRFNSDRNFYRFINNSSLPKHLINILDDAFEQVITSNKDTTKLLKDLNINMHDADIIYSLTEQIESFLENLRLIINEEQNEFRQIDIHTN